MSFQTTLIGKRGLEGLPWDAQKMVHPMLELKLWSGLDFSVSPMLKIQLLQVKRHGGRMKRRKSSQWCLRGNRDMGLNPDGEAHGMVGPGPAVTIYATLRAA